MRTRWIETTTHAGPTVECGEYSAKLQSWTLVFSWPNGGWVWNRPRAIIVEKSGIQERIPIYAVTLLAQIALSLLMAASALSYVAPLIIQPIQRRK